MVLDVPLDEDVVGIVARTGYALPGREVEEFFKRFEFATLVRRVRELSRPGNDAPGVSTADAAAAPTAFPTVEVADGADALLAVLARGDAALGVLAAGEGEGDGRVAAVYDGGHAAVAARLEPRRLAPAVGAAAHVVTHDAKSLPCFTAATSDPAFDTDIAAYLLQPERPENDLFKLAGGDEEHIAEGPRSEALAATRAVLTWRLCGEQRRRLAELGLEPSIATSSCP